MGETFLIARHMGGRETAILKTSHREAVRAIRENKGTAFQLAVLGGKNINTVKRVYGEYAPYRTVDSLDGLLSYVKR
ncbi:hypothetical protein QOZ98_001347 [Planomicrobium stackebrandtii]|uniref:Uncharacterized protein n=1 Tax=Planomicrobium stackebrandtii TaxID=253160 RepID=A0ABU0GT34_9BACL|nr:hypothetical protein [Planomicrobium stackebrandtii]MDQ0428521.1 hypothetical protein [Planomicrobium stackebrandtii]